MPSCFIKTPIGLAEIIGDSFGISSVKIIHRKTPITKDIPLDLKACVHQLNSYFKGDTAKFNLKLNTSGTLFQKKVWARLQSIPFGSTCSYQELSKQMGIAKTIRAVANANAKNPLWIIIPCHRVIGSNGNLTGYAGGLLMKQWLLNHEAGIKQWALF